MVPCTFLFFYYLSWIFVRYSVLAFCTRAAVEIWSHSKGMCSFWSVLCVLCVLLLRRAELFCFIRLVLWKSKIEDASVARDAVFVRRAESRGPENSHLVARKLEELQFHRMFVYWWHSDPTNKKEGKKWRSHQYRRFVPPNNTNNNNDNIPKYCYSLPTAVHEGYDDIRNTRSGIQKEIESSKFEYNN